MTPKIQRFVLDIEPVPKGRPRFTKTGGRYTPEKTKVFEKTVAVLMAGKISPIDGPIGLEATFYLSRPTRLLRKSDPDEAILHFKMPDLDNLLKGLLDALNGIVWYDDRQVCQILARKYFSEKNEDPRIEIIIKEMTDA